MLYDYECKTCGNTQVANRSISEMYNCPQCYECGGETKKVILSAQKGYVQAETNYDCPITGVPITSRKQHEDNLKRHNCRLLEPGETSSVKKNQERDWKNFEKKIGTTIRELAKR